MAIIRPVARLDARDVGKRDIAHCLSLRGVCGEENGEGVSRFNAEEILHGELRWCSKRKANVGCKQW
jgi:hypothetical protein